MKSEHGEIEVLLCPEDDSSASSSSTSSPSFPSSPSSKISTNGFPSPLTKAMIRSRSHQGGKQSQFMPQFIDDEDKSLLLETLDQNQRTACETGVDISSMAVSNEPFLCLEPPLDESAYMFTMDDGEGISNLFDFSF